MVYADVISIIYDSTKSIRKTAVKLGVSCSRIKKVLISSGIYSTARSREIEELYSSGMEATDIADTLKISRSCVNLYLPYTRPNYGSENPTKNASNIRECRKKKQKNVDLIRIR